MDGAEGEWGGIALLTFVKSGDERKHRNATECDLRMM